jgi:hypothetical protein
VWWPHHTTHDPSSFAIHAAFCSFRLAGLTGSAVVDRHLWVGAMHARMRSHAVAMTDDRGTVCWHGWPLLYGLPLTMTADDDDR